MKIVLMVSRLFSISDGTEKLIFNLANSYSNLGTILIYLLMKALKKV